MWSDNRFVATRDPSRGGLSFVATTAGFPKDIMQEIYDDCLEIITKDYDHSCCGVYPLANGQYVIMMAKKISGTIRESRLHEIIRGIVVHYDEMASFCENYMAKDKLHEIFFSDTLDPDHPGRWHMKLTVSSTAMELRDLLDHMDYETTIGLIRALEKIRRENLKIQLIVNDGDEWMTMATCSYVAIKSKLRLFLMVNGECTITPPDIIISNQLSYLEGYKKTNFKQMIRMGLENDEKDKIEEKSQEEINHLVKICEDYVKCNRISEEELYEYIEKLMSKKYQQYSHFRRIMKAKMLHYRYEDCNIHRFMIILYVLFKKNVYVEGSNRSVELCTAPYDFHGMYLFLKKKARSKRELRKSLAAMIKIQFDENIGLAWEKAVNDVCEDVLENL